MPVTHDPGRIVEGQVARSQNGDCAGGERPRRIDPDNLGMSQRAAHKRPFNQAVEMNVVDEAGASAQQAGIFLPQRQAALNGERHQTISGCEDESRVRCLPVSSKLPGDSQLLEARLAQRPLLIGHRIPGGIPVAPFLDHVPAKNALRRKIPSRSAARRDGSLSALHFHS